MKLVEEKKLNSVSFSRSIITSGVTVSANNVKTLDISTLKGGGGSVGITAIEKLFLIATETQNTSFKGKLDWNERKWKAWKPHYFGKLRSEGCPPS
jgi:hypothetical protein